VRIRLWLSVLLFAVVAALVAGGVVFAVRQRRPPNVVLLISDGLGPQITTLARMVAAATAQRDPLSPLSSAGCGLSLVSTRSASSWRTDSAAAGTATACGAKTANSMIGMDPSGVALGSLAEAALLSGRATGIVANSRITHATPASFSAHVSGRYDE
jgi:alkaline phosphatase